MDLELDDTQTELRSSMRRFLADRVPVGGVVRPIVDGASWRADEAWSGLTGLGATGLLAPPDVGGAGLAISEAAIVAEEMGRALYPGPWLATSVAPVRLLTAVREAGGGGEDTDALLAAIADGSTIATAALAGIDAAGRAPVAAGASDADGRSVLRGSLRRVLGLPVADVALVVAIGPDGPGLFLVDRDAVAGGHRADGLDIDATPSLDRTVATGALTLTGVRGRRLGPCPASLSDAVRDEMSLTMGADALGAAQALLDLAVDHAKQRHQFGVPIGSFQAVQHLCVDMFETVELARGGILHAAWAADRATAEERRLAVLRVRGFADELLTVADRCIQVLGGIGFTWEHDAHLFLKRLMTWSQLLGSAAQARVELGRTLSTADTAQP